MRIKHRVSFRSSTEAARSLSGLGFGLPAGGCVTIELYEDDEKWAEVLGWMRDRKPADYVQLEFSDAEVKAASVCRLLPDWHHGYPQPNPNEFGYRTTTYGSSDFCAQCGGGLKQSAPFVLRSEPKWGRRRIMQLNWVFDEYFVETHTYWECFAPAGIAFWPVLDAKGRALDTVVQLHIQEELDVDVSSLASHVCARCGRIKYQPDLRAQCVVLAAPRGGVARSVQTFGDVTDSRAQVFVAADLRDRMQYLKLRGAVFEPALVRDSDGRTSSSGEAG